MKFCGTRPRECHNRILRVQLLRLRKFSAQTELREAVSWPKCVFDTRPPMGLLWEAETKPYFALTILSLGCLLGNYWNLFFDMEDKLDMDLGQFFWRCSCCFCFPLFGILVDKMTIWETNLWSGMHFDTFWQLGGGPFGCSLRCHQNLTLLRR